MSTLLDLFVWFLLLIWSVVSWILWQLLWIVVWLLLPLAILAVLAVRLAEWSFGREVVRAWVKAQSLRLGAGVWVLTRRILFALGVLPLRVLGWLAVYALWHSVVSLLWRPRWSPWQRAWAKRWRQTTAA